MAPLRLTPVVLFELVLWLLASPGCHEELRVLTDRTPTHLEALLAHHDAARPQLDIEVDYVGDGLLARLENRPREADLVITKNAFWLQLAKQKGLLTPFESPAISAQVPPTLRDSLGYFTTLSYRARVIYYAKARVDSAELSTYLALADPKWRGRICMRSGFHDYNLSLFSQLAARHGEARLRTFLTGLKKNLARLPRGNDRAQIRAIAEGQCDLAIANSYYMGIMLGRDDQRPWALATRVFFPDQQGDGTAILRSAAGLTQANRHRRQATALLEFLTDSYAQIYFAQGMFAYPVKSGVPLSAINRDLGRDQGISSGVFKPSLLPVATITQHREAVLQTLAQLRFDDP